MCLIATLDALSSPLLLLAVSTFALCGLLATQDVIEKKEEGARGHVCISARTRLQLSASRL